MILTPLFRPGSRAADTSATITMISVITVLLACLCLSVIACSAPDDAADAGSGTRIVLITLDTLRYDSLTPAPGDTPQMPEVLRWAEGGTQFTRAFSASSSTQPSHASMLTGLHPWQHGVDRNGVPLPDEVVTVPEVLRDAGYVTAAAVASFPVVSRFGFAQGFDTYLDDYSRGSVGSRWLGDARKTDPDFADPGDFYNLGDLITERALQLLDDAEGDRQFFWFHYFDPHSPYGDSAKALGDNDAETIKPRPILETAEAGGDPWPMVEEARILYRQDVEFLDLQLSRVLQRLEADSERFTTHVVITADHGESFGEDLSMAHGRRLTPAQIHVPLVIHSPRLPAGTVDLVAGSVDIAETLIAFADAPAPSNQGRDLAATPTRPPRAYGMRRLYNPPYEDRRLDGSIVEISGPLFYLVDRDGRLYRGNEEMLESPVDATQAQLEESGPVPAALEDQLRRLFRTFEQELRGVLQSDNLESSLDDESRAALRALGYVD